MSKALRIMHGSFGRAILVSLDHTVTVHAHRTCQIMFRIDGGDLDVVVRDQRHRLGENDVVVLNAWEPHSYEITDEQSPVTALSLYLDPAWLKRMDKRFANCMHPRFFSVRCASTPDVARELVADIVELIAYEPEPESEWVEELVLKLALALAVPFSNHHGLSPFETVGGVACDARIRKVLSMMRETVGEPIVMENLARQAGMSRPHFFHLFKQETQLTPMVYSSMLRMEAAVSQIVETSDSLLDISLRLGFESPGNFTRFFNMNQGFPPSHYRRSAMSIRSERKTFGSAPPRRSNSMLERAGVAATV